MGIFMLEALFLAFTAVSALPVSTHLLPALHHDVLSTQLLTCRSSWSTLCVAGRCCGWSGP